MTKRKPSAKTNDSKMMAVISWVEKDQFCVYSYIPCPDLLFNPAAIVTASLRFALAKGV